MGRSKDQPNFQIKYNPADIPSLAAAYMKTDKGEDQKMEDAGKRVRDGDYSRANLETICRWKSVRRIALLSDNTDEDIKQALEGAIKALDVKKAVDSLTALAGVGVKMASAILTAIYPERYTVLDFRALEALGVEDREDVDFYIQYVEACLSMAKKFGVTLRNFDRANWLWSKSRSVRLEDRVDELELQVASLIEKVAKLCKT